MIAIPEVNQASGSCEFHAAAFAMVSLWTSVGVSNSSEAMMNSWFKSVANNEAGGSALGDRGMQGRGRDPPPCPPGALSLDLGLAFTKTYEFSRWHPILGLIWWIGGDFLLNESFGNNFFYFSAFWEHSWGGHPHAHPTHAWENPAPPLSEIFLNSDPNLRTTTG